MFLWQDEAASAFHPKTNQLYFRRQLEQIQTSSSSIFHTVIRAQRRPVALNTLQDGNIRPSLTVTVWKTGSQTFFSLLVDPQMKKINMFLSDWAAESPCQCVPVISDVSGFTLLLHYHHHCLKLWCFLWGKNKKKHCLGSWVGFRFQICQF